MPHDRALPVSIAASRPVARDRARSPGAITRRPEARHGLDASGRVLWIDTVAVDLETVVGVEASGFSEKDLSTAFATIAIFSGVAAVMVFGVVEIGWRVKFLLEGVLFGSIALCAVAELFSARRNTLFRFRLSLADGRMVEFATADRAAALALKAALDHHASA